jgi:hypothetical protein
MTSAGNVIAGDVFIQKGIEAVSGVVSYVDYAGGFFRLNGVRGDAASGVMVRLNDPDARHTIQAGPGCAAGSPNCSPDPRFTLDGDNYTNVFSTGYPYCIPSTVARPFPGLPAATGVAAIPAGVAQAGADGSGDLLCPTTNRTVNGGQPVQDSRRFAPIQVGDQITVEGNFELVNGTRFLSAHSSAVGRALLTSNAPDMPDYIFLDEVEIDAAGFQNQRARTLFIGYATLAPTDVLIWSIHYDPGQNEPHLFPLATVQGCDTADGAGTCGSQGLVGAGNLIWKIRHDVDFLVGAKPRLNPCAHLASDPRMPPGVCPNGPLVETNTSDMFAILSPIPHEIQAYTGHRLAFPALANATIDVSGNTATNGQYLFPFGIGLGGIAFPEMNEINLDAMGTPFSFTGLPWLLDRRLSPAGCVDTDGDGVADCEATPQPLDPFPFEGIDPRTQASVPQIPYASPVYTASPLARTANRILSYVDPVLGTFDGNRTVLAWPPVNPAALPILPEPVLGMVCGAGVPGNSPPTAVNDTATTVAGRAVTIGVLANDTDPEGNALLVTAVTDGLFGTAATNGTTVTFTPAVGFTGTDTFSYTVSDGIGGSANGVVTVQVTTGPQPATGVTLAAIPGSPQVTGTPVLFTATATGGSAASYQYQFNVWQVNTKVATSGWIATNAWTMPGTIPAGSYTVQVLVRTSPNVSFDVFFNLPYQITAAAILPATGVTLGADSPSPHPTGTPVLFTATASGGTASAYQYQFNLWQVNTKVATQAYGPANTWQMPGTIPPGKYTVQVLVRTSTAVNFDTFLNLPYEVVP